ncbi:hypothetical protein Tco_0711464, partial [Tanacetum coccineum]
MNATVIPILKNYGPNGCHDHEDGCSVQRTPIWSETIEHPDQRMDEDIPMSREEEVKFMQTFRKTSFYNDYRDRNLNRDNWRSSERNDYNRDNYRSNTDDKSYDLQRQFNDFMKAQQSTNAFVKETFMDLKAQLETVGNNSKAYQPSGSLPSNTQPNPRGNNSKAYQPPQTRNEHVNVVFTRSGKSYDSPINPNDQQDDAEIFDSDDENEEPTPQPKPQPLKPIKETPTPKPYKPKIPYPQRLRKEKMEAQYGKFLDIIRVVRINAPLIDILAGMPNYGKFLKELVSNKHKIEQIYAAFLSDESSAMIQNKVPPKLGDPGTMAKEENYESKSDTEEQPFEKITINTDYKIKTSLEEPLTNLELKPRPDNLEYIFLEESSFLLVIVSSQLSAQNKGKLVSVLKKHKEAFAWKTTDIPGICPSF